jgi:acyl-CoA synthetase (AMP-forming)/AMP-acid ligase II
MTVGAAPALLAGLSRAAAERPDAAALHLPRGRRHRPGPAGFTTVTFAELDRSSDAVARGLVGHAVPPGVRTALLVPPSRSLFVAAVALVKAGLVPVLIDPGLGLGHVRTCLAEAEVDGFLAVPRAHLARRALRWCPQARHLVTVGPPLPGGGPTLRALEAAGVRDDATVPLPAPPDPDALAAIAFTSGSTGVPKGVAYRHRHFCAQLHAVAEVYELQPGQVTLATFPPFALLTLLLGITTVVPRMDPTRPAQVNPGRVVDAAASFAATTMFGSPALIDTLGRWGETSGERLPTLRRVVSAGAPVAAVVRRRVLAMLPPGAEVVTPYGATEALPVTTVSSTELGALTEPGVCVGRPVPGVDVAVIPVTDDPLPVLPTERVPPGEVGEIVVRGPNVTDSYVGRPVETALAKADWDGVTAHRMGDLGRVDAAGRLWFCGRKSQRVTTPAGMLSTSPLEEQVNQHPGVRRAALVGLGPPGRQHPVVCVQLEPGQRPSPALTAELLRLLADVAAPVPLTDVRYLGDLPVDIRHNAKIDRPALAARLARPRR